ncbi:unnamed protein product [Rhodiola kirilowii]
MWVSGSSSSQVGDEEEVADVAPLSVRIPDETGGDGISFNVPQPLDCLQGSTVPPFLSKTYDLVDDPALDRIISWGAGGDSFVVWDPVDFSRIVLPRNFKHNNFSSFVRQLNTYVGNWEMEYFLAVETAVIRFRKIDADKWEFANTGFVRGKKHLLKSIQRRKSPQSQQESNFGACAEAGRPGLEDEVEKLKKERKMLMHEVAELQIEQEGTAHHMELVNQRIQIAEKKQKQMVTFLSKLFQNPAFLARLQSEKAHSQIESPKMKRKFITHQSHVAGRSGLNIEKWIAKSWPDQSQPYESSTMLDATSVPIPQLPGYLPEDLVGKLNADSGNIALTKNDVLVTELPTSKELAALEEFITTPEVTNEDFKSRDSLFKGKGKVDDLDNFSPDYLVSFPEDMGKEKGIHGLSTSGTESSCKQEDAWCLGFDTNMVISSPNDGLWDNVADYNMPEFGARSSFSDVWEFGSSHVAAGLELVLPDECAFDELDALVDQKTEDK